MALTFGNKIENEGATAQGRLTAAEFNTLVSAVNQNETDIGRIELNYALTNGLSIAYDNVEREIQLKYTKSGQTRILATIDADDFVIGGSLRAASYATEDENHVQGEFLKLEFSTGDTIYIDLSSVVGSALSAMDARITVLENRHVILSESEFENLAEIDPDKIYMTYEDEEEPEVNNGGEGE